MLCAFLILILPSNTGAAFRRIDFGGHTAGPIYLLMRIPLQLILIGWILWFAIAPRRAVEALREAEERPAVLRQPGEVVSIHVFGFGKAAFLHECSAERMTRQQNPVLLHGEACDTFLGLVRVPSTRVRPLRAMSAES